MKKKIIVEYGEQAAIAKILGCTVEMVCHSLAFRKNSLLARQIRKVAIERGGVEVELKTTAKHTTYAHSPSFMPETFSRKFKNPQNFCGFLQKTF